ncbi:MULTISPECIES: hypothetical protein [Streptomyces]|uniref:DUF3551 domain-containing protein n=1 Tax=Streptomyces lycii TaxID=2654337 RepID=A0ABQ7FIP2_9ACTN|nr:MULTISPECIES: hypothetical protein [Streptomyces]KAF4408483.1 hypothetical protein GCU69_13675 [Streptomyces lycii]PGH52163.1 hypothetical protein CRI70_02850 [Streptomyces sp. Ru87]
MTVRTLFAGAGVGAALVLGTVTAPAQAAPAPAPMSPAGILSCPSGAPAASPGYRCLSSYSTADQCHAGVARNISVTPATMGYCAWRSPSWWGYVNY